MMTHEMTNNEADNQSKSQGQRRRRRRKPSSGAGRGNRSTAGEHSVVAHSEAEKPQRQRNERSSRSRHTGGGRNRQSRREKNEVAAERVREILLPAADVIQEYEYALEGSGDRLLAMAESEQQHRQAWENHYLRSQIKSQRIGQLFGLAIAFATIAVVVSFANAGQEILATVFGTAVFIAMAVSGIVGSRLVNGGKKKRYRRR